MADKIVVLQAGIIEQAGSPLELYHHPDNLFVAGFIGSPKMNFLKAAVTSADGGGATVTLPGGGGLTVPVQPDRLEPGEDVMLGVRPEHLRVGDDGEIRGEVLVVERLGGETYLYVQVEPELMLVVQADGDNPTRVHDRVAIRIDPEACHLFDAAGLAVPRARRHPLADAGRDSAARKAS